MVNLINLKDMNDYMRVRFTDGVIADVIKINIEAFCGGKTFSPPEDIIKHNIKLTDLMLILGNGTVSIYFHQVQRNR